MIEPERGIGPADERLGASMAEEDPFAALAGRHRQEEWRREWINRFRQRQRVARRWIEFVEIAKWCARSVTGTSADDEQRALELAYRWLANSVLQGEFEAAGRSMILYLIPKVVSIGANQPTPDWSEAAQKTDARFRGEAYPHRLTRESFEAVLKTEAQFQERLQLAATTPASSLPMNVLVHCWLPREMARRWLESHGYRWAPQFEPAPKLLPEGASGSLAVPASVQRPSTASIRAIRRPPSREKKFWPAVRVAAFKWLTENDCPAPGDGNQATLERFVAGWLEDRGHEASESAVRRHVACWIKEYRDELNA